MLTGTVDRLVIGFADRLPVCAEIIDFKSDAVTGEDVDRWLDERTRRHRSQLQAYALGVASAVRIPMDRIARTIAFLRTGQHVNL